MMIPVSVDFMESIHADARETTGLVKIYLDGDSEAPLELRDDDIVQINALEETGAESNKPLGVVTANTCEISLNNEGRRFSILNPDSDLAGKLLPNKKVEAFVGLRLDDDTFEYVKIGTYRTTIWDEVSGGLEAYVQCTDILYWLARKPVPDLGIMLNVSLGEVFAKLFTALGLTSSQYNIDPLLTTVIPVAWIPGGDFFDVVEKLAISGNCVVYVNRNGIVQVRINGDTPVVDTFTDNDLILDITNQQNALNLPTGIKVHYNVPSLLKDEELIYMTGISVPSLTTVTLSNIEFRVSPVRTVRYIKSTTTDGVIVTVKDVTAKTCTLELTNTTSTAKEVEVTIMGEYYVWTKSSITIYDPVQRALRGDDVYELDSEFVQVIGQAQLLASSLLAQVVDPFARFSISSRMNPALELMDTFNVEAPVLHIDEATVQILRQTIIYDGALDGSIEARGRRST